jgi:hypothetical protein
MFGKGKIFINIPRTGYLPGDTITGDVTLKPNKPVKGREVSISLIGEQKVTHRRMTGRGRYSSTTETIRIYEFSQQLDIEKEYSREQVYHFEMKIPEGILNLKPGIPELGGGLDQGLKIAHTAATVMGIAPFQRTKWYLSAKLDIPGGLDINKKADITIG